MFTFRLVITSLNPKGTAEPSVARTGRKGGMAYSHSPLLFTKTRDSVCAESGQIKSKSSDLLSQQNLCTFMTWTTKCFWCSRMIRCACAAINLWLKFTFCCQEKYGIEPTMVVHGVKMLYVPIMPGHSKRLKLT